MSNFSSALDGGIDGPAQREFYIDSHCHFDFSAFDHDRQALWQSCTARNIRGLIIPGVEPSQWPHAISICESFPGAGFAVGLHPWWIANYLQAFHSQDEAIAALLEALAQYINHDVCVGVGECGLDKRIPVSMQTQLAFFCAQLRFAKGEQKPLIIHSVKSHNEVLKCLKDHRFDGGGVIHAFSGNSRQAQDFVEAGFAIGVGGTITYERATKTRAAVKQLALSDIVLETDAPDMPLAGHQGQRNTPEFIIEIAQVLAEIRGQTVDEIARKTSENSMRIFGLKKANNTQIL